MHSHSDRTHGGADVHVVEADAGADAKGRARPNEEPADVAVAAFEDRCGDMSEASALCACGAQSATPDAAREAAGEENTAADGVEVVVVVGEPMRGGRLASLDPCCCRCCFCSLCDVVYCCCWGWWWCGSDESCGGGGEERPRRPTGEDVRDSKSPPYARVRDMVRGW